MRIGLKHVALAGIAVMLMASCNMQQQYRALERKVNMQVFRAERLESVMMRLALNTGRRYDVQVLTISGIMAKAADYKEVPMRLILEQQLTGTPFTYRLTKNELKILMR